MKKMAILTLVLGATGCAFGGQQGLRMRNQEAGIESQGWTTGDQLPTVTVASASATATVLDARTRGDVERVAVRTDDYVERRGADLPYAALAAQTSERTRLTEGLRLQQAACASRFADGHESVTCLVLNQQVVAVLNGGQGYYLPGGGSWIGGGGGYYSSSAIQTVAAIEAARRRRDMRLPAMQPGEAVDPEARRAIRLYSRSLRGFYQNQGQNQGSATIQEGEGQ